VWGGPWKHGPQADSEVERGLWKEEEEDREWVVDGWMDEVYRIGPDRTAQQSTA
jgi:hypothetical protein